jgi:hypothetical protein
MKVLNAPAVAAGVCVAVFAAVLAAAVPLAAAAPEARAAAPTMQLAQRFPFDIFRRRGFPINTCESRCQEERNRCEARARDSNERRDCRLEYGVCSNDCDVFQDRR